MNMKQPERLSDYLRPDFGRDQFIALLVIVTLVTSALAVAYSVHKYRIYVNDLQQLQVERDQLDVEWGQLLLEQHSWGAYGRVGKMATEDMQMRTPSPQEVIMVRQ